MNDRSPPSQSALLDLWELTASATPAGRARIFAAAADPAAAGLSVTAADEAIASLRRAVHGEKLEALAACPACAAELEFDCVLADVTPASAPADGSWRAIVGDWTMELRLPTLDDCRDLAPGDDVTAARRSLFARVATSIAQGGRPMNAADVPQSVIAGAEAALAAHDPQGAKTVALHCPECGHDWSAPFDIASYFALEINFWALRTLEDVHALATAYGWTEQQVLALHPRRRERYLTMAVR